MRRLVPIGSMILVGACSSFTASDAPTNDADAGVDAGTADGSFDAGPVAIDPPVAVSAGGGIGCVLRTSGAVDCWGDNADGVIAPMVAGQDACTGFTTACVPAATRSPLVGRAVQISVGDGFVCALVAGSPSSVMCWGKSRFGTLGDGKGDSSSAVPVAVPLDGPPLEVAAGRGNACARVLINGRVDVQCWGTSTIGINGQGPSNRIEKPIVVVGAEGTSALSLSLTDPASACVIGGQNLVKCWGSNRYGALGHAPENGGGCTVDGPYAANDHPCSSTPQLAENLDATNAIATGVFTTCALRSGAVACWGFNGWGGHAKGAVDNDAHSAAVPSTLAGTATKLTGRSGHFCALLDDGTARCWGAAGQNQLGTLANTTDGLGFARRAQPTPQQIALADVTDISAGEDFTLAIAGGEVYAWGTNTRGQLGHRPVDDSVTCEGTGRCNGTPTKVALPQLAVTR